jgi:hypothetical protein
VLWRLNASQPPRSRGMLVVRTFLSAFTGDAISKVAILATSLIAAGALTPVALSSYRPAGDSMRHESEVG